MEVWWLTPILGGFLLSVLLSPITRRFALRAGFIDHPDGVKKKHREPIALLGGMGIFLAFTTVSLILEIRTGFFTEGDLIGSQLFGACLGGLLLLIGGAIDDKYQLPAKFSVAFPILSALTATLFGIGISQMTNPFGDPIEIGTILSGLITFVWILVMTYSTKLLDGIDGLVASLGMISAIIIAGLALSIAYFQPDVALLALIIAASIFGFLLWNIPPAHHFLGEGGSTLIGYSIAVIAVIAGSKLGTAALVMGIAAIDMVLVILARAHAGLPIWKGGDGRHLHRRLERHGWRPIHIVILYVFVGIGFGAITFLFVSLAKIIAFLLMALFVTGLVYALDHTYRRD
ncbi:MAG: MraY family glycosyltransferase [bacterium]|nr:MraY family glycosyltransferase [bacterium]MDA1024510.1 MraY family glycosyltransferase [bacterium]